MTDSGLMSVFGVIGRLPRIVGRLREVGQVARSWSVPGSWSGRGSELTAGTVDLLTTGVPDGRGDAARAQPLDEGVLHPRVTGRPLGSGSRVERDRIDVDPAAAAR